MPKQLYYAAPLFSNMELQYNDYLVKKLRKRYSRETFYVPQEQMSINDKQNYADSMTIAKYDTAALLASKVMIAILDGPVIDVGVASEIGVAYQAGIPIVALFSDNRQQGASSAEKLAALQKVAESQFPYANLYTIGLIKLNGKVLASEEEWLSEIGNYL